MRTIRIHCNECMESFDFQHPAVNRASDLQNVTLNCARCGATLKAPEDELTMISMRQYLVRAARAAGIEVSDRVPIGYVEVGEGAEVPQMVDEVTARREAKRPTPAIMPPHPPAKPATQEKRPRNSDRLTHRPFQHGITEYRDNHRDR